MHSLLALPRRYSRVRREAARRRLAPEGIWERPFLETSDPLVVEHMSDGQLVREWRAARGR